MRTLGILGLGALLAITGCAPDSVDDGDSASEDLVSSAPHAFSISEMTPKAAKTFATPTGKTEICVIPKHFSDDGYAKKDAKKEAKFCNADFNAAPADGISAAGLAPKANSTNPATDVHEVTAAISRDVVESFAEANAHDRKAKKLGRIKSSLDDRFDKTSTYATSRITQRSQRTEPSSRSPARRS